MAYQPKSKLVPGNIVICIGPPEMEIFRKYFQRSGMVKQVNKYGTDKDEYVLVKFKELPTLWFKRINLTKVG